MKKTAVAFALIVFSMAIFLPFSLYNPSANAQTSSYAIQRVDQTVQVLYSGHVLITEKIQLSGQVPGTFEIGLPYKYGSSLLKGSAYDSSNNALSVTLGVQLQDQTGFYGATITLPQGTSNTFTVFFVLSNAVLTSATGGYTLDFPAYLGLPQTTADYAASLTLPTGATLQTIDKTDGSINTGTYEKQNLQAFTYAPATAIISASTGVIQEVNVQTLNRQVRISQSGDVTSTDTYKLVNNGTVGVNSFLINLPVSSTNVVARDQFGKVLSSSVQQNTAQALVENVTLGVSMESGESSLLIFDYSLPKVSPTQFAHYVFNLDLFPNFNYYIESASVTIVPPEGATIVTPNVSQIGASADLSRNAFQETLTITKQGVTFVDSNITSEDVVPITLDYNPLWISFRPTSWMFAIALIGVILVAIWKRPKAKVAASPVRVAVIKLPAGMTLNQEHIKEFIEAYEEKTKINQELRALEARAQHGRIPRRRYKVQRRTLELRLETLSQTIEQLKEILRSSGGNYSDIVRQLETADIELNEIGLSLQTIEVRHETGELALDAYRKQLSDLERRKNKAEATINGLLLRLRGEIR